MTNATTSGLAAQISSRFTTKSVEPFDALKNYVEKSDGFWLVKLVFYGRDIGNGKAKWEFIDDSPPISPAPRGIESVFAQIKVHREAVSWSSPEADEINNQLYAKAEQALHDLNNSTPMLQEGFRTSSVIIATRDMIGNEKLDANGLLKLIRKKKVCIIMWETDIARHLCEAFEADCQNEMQAILEVQEILAERPMATGS